MGPRKSRQTKTHLVAKVRDGTHASNIKKTTA